MGRRWWTVIALLVGLAVVMTWNWQSPGVVPSEAQENVELRKKPTTYWRQELLAGPGRAAVAREQLEAQGGWSLPVLRDLLKSEEEPDGVTLRLTTLEILGRLGTEATPLSREVLGRLKDPDEHVRTVAITLLPKLQISAREALPLLEAFYDQPEAVAALRATAEYRAQALKSLPTLEQVLRDKSRPTEVRWNASRTIGKIGGNARSAVPLLIECLTDPEATIREHCAEAIGDIGPSAAELGVPALIPMLKDENARVRRDTVRSLGQLGEAGRAALPQIRELSEDPEEIVREAVRGANQKREGTGPGTVEQPAQPPGEEKPKTGRWRNKGKTRSG